MIVDLDGIDDSRWTVVLPVLQELRPHISREVLGQILSEGQRQGLRFTALFQGDICVAVAGWRVLATTSVIRKLYVDDLSTAAEARSSGYGAQLLSELTRRAREFECATIELDSGVQRHDAHRFYLRERMDINSFHFGKSL